MSLCLQMGQLDLTGSPGLMLLKQSSEHIIFLPENSKGLPNAYKTYNELYTWALHFFKGGPKIFLQTFPSWILLMYLGSSQACCTHRLPYTFPLNASSLLPAKRFSSSFCSQTPWTSTSKKDDILCFLQVTTTYFFLESVQSISTMPFLTFIFILQLIL